jgi:ARG and Rhodanese-Phosphatase-superfamily-associated Protein domain
MPTVADIAPICALLTRLTPGQPLRSGALTCIPLLTSSLHDPDWLTLTDARDAAVVTEVDQDGVVSALSVTNRAGRPLLLLDGDELVGAKQNRVLNTTVLVAARSQLTIPVSCVEQGRWQRRGERFAPGNASLYASLRARKAARVSESLGRAYSGHRDHSVRAIVITRSEVS